MNPTETLAALNLALDSDLPCMIWGAPGIGKSDLMRQAAKARGVPLIDLRAVLLDPVDLRGLPSVSEGKAVWLPMGELPDERRDGTHGILFLDEINAAPPAVQAACFGLVLDRKLGEYRLPSGWRVVAAGNRRTDRASAQAMPSALANRFLHLGMESSLDSWCQWAIAHGVQPELVAFLRFRPALLHDFQPDRTVNPTPRTWAMADRILKAKAAPHVELAALAGLVGDAAAAELIGFLKVWRTLPSPDAVFLNPDAVPVPTSAATLYALCGALARKVTAQSFDRMTQFLQRVPPEYGVAAVKDATARDAALITTPAYIAWSSANSDLYT